LVLSTLARGVTDGAVGGAVSSGSHDDNLRVVM
jgi:hypothetical protein